VHYTNTRTDIDTQAKLVVSKTADVTRIHLIISCVQRYKDYVNILF